MYIKLNTIITVKKISKEIWAASWQNKQNDMWAQRRLRSAWSSDQFDQCLHCLQEESFGPYLSIECTAKALIRLDGCPGWSESSLGAQSFRWFRHEATHIKIRLQMATCSSAIYSIRYLSQLMRLWHFSSSVISFFKRACATVQGD